MQTLGQPRFGARLGLAWILQLQLATTTINMREERAQSRDTVIDLGY